MDEIVAVELDRETLDALNQRAERHGLSVGEEIGAIVRQQVSAAGSTPDWVARARAIRAMTPPGSIQVETWKLIRASRDWDH
jgi:plasmid stability protein